MTAVNLRFRITRGEGGAGETALPFDRNGSWLGGFCSRNHFYCRGHIVMNMRIQCCVPFCRRTIAADKLPPEHNEWLCIKHWPLVPASLRHRKRRAERIARRKQTEAAWRLASALWQRCKRAAIERAGGLQ
ncbi:hypothetical protein D584_19913 [Brucella intermedia M86]|uniref:Uncharacterized protein n=1 Tax=Brucella intermedia M86 TaxID=1234597 RepID=M5JUZ3_9HYPH|nr:hypothetical protein D584_19913 [Brucella intermedia M86]